MAAKTSGDSTERVSGNIFFGIQDSFTTQGLSPNGAPFCPIPAATVRPGLLKPKPALRVKVVYRSDPDALRAV
jgi:hypothetical protein